MTNSDYSVENLITNDSFWAYVYNTDAQSMAYWQEWIRLHPEQLPLIEEATLIARSLAIKTINVSEETIDQEVEKLERSLAGSKIIALNPTTESTSPKRWFIWSSVAAAVLLLLTCTLAIWFYSRPASDLLTTTTRAGASAMLVLPDSSLVFLSGNSTIRYRENWEAHAGREVWLEGEAFFHVKPKPVPGGVKFLVHAGRAVVEVVGTRFNVLNRDNQTKVALTSGKVNLMFKEGLAEKQMALVPGEMVSLTTDNVSPQKNKINISHYPALKEEKIVFENTSIRKIILLLREQYGLKVSLQDSAMADLTVSGSFPLRNEKVFLKTLAVVLDLDIQKGTNREVHFRYK